MIQDSSDGTDSNWKTALLKEDVGAQSHGHLKTVI